MRRARHASILLAAILTACGGDPGSPGPATNATLLPTTMTAVNPSAKLSLLRSSGLSAVADLGACDVDMAPIDYPTAGVAGEETNATGVLLVPSGANCPAGPYPLLAYARGTDVLKSRTLADPDDSETQALAAVFASHGYVVVATDYLGYAGSRYPYHPFLHADSEASSVIDSIRTAQAVAASRGIPLSGKVMVAGYSQGGHASMAAQREIERDNTSGINLVAAGHMSGPYNLSQSVVGATTTTPILGGQLVAAFLITAWQKVYGNLYEQPADAFRQPYAAGIEDLFPGPYTKNALLESGRVPPDGTSLPALLQPDYLNDIAGNTNDPTLVAARKNDLLGWNPKAKTVLCGGSEDPVINFAINTKTAQADFASRGVNVPVIDVDPTIRRLASLLGESVDLGTYHAGLVPALCMTALRDRLFDPMK